MRLSAKRLLTRNVRRSDVIEHYCMCKPPCADAAHTVPRIDQSLATPSLRKVDVINRQSWTGLIDIVQWFGFWLSCHGLGRDAFIRAFQPARAAPDASSGGNTSHDHVPAVAAEMDGAGALLPAAGADVDQNEARRKQRERLCWPSLGSGWIVIQSRTCISF